MSSEYILGNVVRCSVSFRNEAGILADPTAVIFKLRLPSGTITTYTFGVGVVIVKDGVGLYRVDVDAGFCGIWEYRFYSTGSGQAAEEGKFQIVSSRFD